MILLGSFESKRWGHVCVKKSNYISPGGPIAIILETQSGSRIDMLSDCSHDSEDLPKDCFFVKRWSENEDISAEALGSGLFIERTDLEPAKSAPVWQIAPKRVLELLYSDDDNTELVGSFEIPEGFDFEALNKLISDFLNAGGGADAADAARYRFLRDLPDSQCGQPGYPCIAVAGAPPSGRSVALNGEDADKAVDEAMERNRRLSSAKIYKLAEERTKIGNKKAR